MTQFHLAISRLALACLTLWGLAMVLPDLGRPFRPLASFGLSVDADGTVTDVRTPFAAGDMSPAWQAGVRPGDRLNPSRTTCVPVNTLICATAQALLGKLLFVTPDRAGEVILQPTAEQPARTVSLAARAVRLRWDATVLLFADQIAAVLVILAAAWLVLTRQSAMTWAFFLYVMWFNPGQSYTYYAWLQLSSSVLLLQGLVGAIAQGVGLTALLVFAVLAPANQSAARWRPLLRSLPIVAAALVALLVASFANVFGFPTELITRLGVASGFVVAVAAFAILLARRSELAPAEYQRLRWVIWGSAIGLPALIVADLGQQTTVLFESVGQTPPTDAAWDLLRLLNGFLCLFVSEAVRRPRIINVAIPLRRVTSLGLLLSFPALLLHHQADHLREEISEQLHLPGWVWAAVAAGLVFAISRLHEWTVHIADHHLSRPLRQAADGIGAEILSAQDAATVDRALSLSVRDLLGLTSATLYRWQGLDFRLDQPEADPWGAASAEMLADPAILKRLDEGQPFETPFGKIDASRPNIVPDRTVLVVPIVARFRRYGLVCYGEHVSGTAFSRDERRLLVELASKAVDVYAKLERGSLLSRIDILEQRLAHIGPPFAAAERGMVAAHDSEGPR